MSKEQSLGDIAATLLASVPTVTVTDTDVVERIKDAEAAMRSLPMTIDDIDGHLVVRHEYAPSKTLDFLVHRQEDESEDDSEYRHSGSEDLKHWWVLSW